MRTPISDIGFAANTSATLSCSFYLSHCSRCPNRTQLLDASTRDTTQVATSLMWEARKKGDEELGMLQGEKNCEGSDAMDKLGIPGIEQFLAREGCGRLLTAKWS